MVLYLKKSLFECMYNLIYFEHFVNIVVCQMFVVKGCIANLPINFETLLKYAL